jgi:SAM-dependent methyltransferase
VGHNACRLCAGRLFPQPIVHLQGMPRAAQFFPTRSEFATDEGIVLDVFQCSTCGLVQLSVSPVDYYREVITAASLSPDTRRSRLAQMRAFGEAFGLAGKSVLEVGCATGGMLDILTEAGFRATGIEASVKSVETGRAAGRQMVHGYIGDIAQIPGQPFDAFVCLNYLEHLPDPAEILRNIHRNTTPEAVGFVTVPNLQFLLDSKCLYEFVADHLSYFDPRSLQHAFELTGFEVLKCELINEDNDIAATVRKRRPAPSAAISVREPVQPRDISSGLAEVDTLIGRLQKVVVDYTSRGKKVAVWGAGHRTLALLALAKLDTIEFVVDSAKFKQGRFTPVLHTDIVAPERLKETPVDLVMVMVPGLYPDEVVKTLGRMELDVDVLVHRGNDFELRAR